MYNRYVLFEGEVVYATECVEGLITLTAVIYTR